MVFQANYLDCKQLFPYRENKTDFLVRCCNSKILPKNGKETPTVEDNLHHYTFVITEV